MVGAAMKAFHTCGVELGSEGLKMALDDQVRSHSISLRSQTCPTTCESDSWIGLWEALDLV